MTREQIEKEAVKMSRKIYCEYNQRLDYVNGFINGAEYCINSVWHDGNERPKIDRKLLTYLESNCCEIDYLYKEDFDWEYYADIRGIVRWAYIEDLLPDGKEEI